MPRWCSWMVAAALVLGGGAARAEEPEAPAPDPEAQARAKDLYDIAARAYDEGRYQLAIEAFRGAYDLTRHPEMLFNIANAQERFGDLAGAKRSLEQYLPLARPDEQGALSARIESLRVRIEAEAAAAEVRAAAVLPPVIIAPPAPTPVPVPVPEPAPVAPRPQPRWGLVAVGGGSAAAFGGVAAGTFILSRQWKETGDTETYNRWLPVNNASLALSGVGLVVATVGFVLRGPAEEEGPEAALFLTPNGIAARF